MVNILKYFTFTSSIRKILINISFRLKIYGKFMKILLKRNRILKKKTLYFSNKIVFDKSVFTLAYDFENALYYELKGFHKSINPQVIEIFNNQMPNSLEFIVYGFRKKETFFLEFSVTNKIFPEKLEPTFLETFEVEIINLRLAYIQNNFETVAKTIQTNIPKPQIKKYSLKYQPTSFNIKNYI